MVELIEKRCPYARHKHAVREYDGMEADWVECELNDKMCPYENQGSIEDCEVYQIEHKEVTGD